MCHPQTKNSFIPNLSNGSIYCMIMEPKLIRPLEAPSFYSLKSMVASIGNLLWQIHLLMCCRLISIVRKVLQMNLNLPLMDTIPDRDMIAKQMVQDSIIIGRIVSKSLKRKDSDLVHFTLLSQLRRQLKSNRGRKNDL